MKNMVRKFKNWLVMSTFSHFPKFENVYKWRIYDFLNDLFSPMEEEYGFVNLFKRNKWIFKVSLIPLSILILGIILGIQYKQTETDLLETKNKKLSTVANRFYELSKHKQDSLMEIKSERDSLLSYFESREWLEYVIYKESDISIPEHLPDSVFHFMMGEKNKYDIPNSIYWRLVFKESSFQMIANKTSGAYGYMQVMPATYEYYRVKVGVDTTHTPYNNIRVGSYILNEHYRKFIAMGYEDKRAWELALSSYNAGIGNVMRCGYNIPNFKETKDYVSFILDRYEDA